MFKFYTNFYIKLNKVAEYINYCRKAKGRHGTHSPFVYDFNDKCLKIAIPSTWKLQIGDLTEKLKRDQRKITITDFGAGSRKLGNTRSVSAILKTSSSNGKFSELLYRLSAYYKPKNILEFGTSLGIGTSNLATGNTDAVITTVEACANTRAVAMENFSRLKLSNIKSIEATFDDFLSQYSGEKFDLVYIDGHHDGQALLRYLNQLKSISHNDTIFLLDDIRWSDSMLQAWKSIISDSEYHVTMDLFRMGIVLPRHQQEKEHFVITY